MAELHYTKTKNDVSSKKLLGTSWYQKSGRKSRLEEEWVINPKPSYTYISIPDVNYELKIPIELNKIANEIEKSRYILDLKENWDDEGALPYEKQTWGRAARLLALNAISIYKTYGLIIEEPMISHSINGSIDIYWQNEKYMLLLNIPKDPNDLVTYFGRSLRSEGKQEQIKGAVKEDFLPLMLCLETIR